MISQSSSLMFCQQCGTTGAVAGKRCPACYDRAVGRVHGAFFEYWSYAFDPAHVRERAIRVTFDRVVNILLVIGIVAAFGVYAYVVFSYILPLTIAAVFVLFLVTRLIRRAHVSLDVPEQPYLHTNETSESALSTLSWSDVRRRKSREIKNISDAFSRDALHALETAYARAVHDSAPQVTVTHLCAALLNEESIQTTLLRLLVRPQDAQERSADLLSSGSTAGAIPLIHADVWNVIFDAYDHASQLREPRVGATELFEIAVTHDPSMQAMLLDLGIKQSALANALEWIRMHGRLKRQIARRARGSRGRSKGDTNRAMTAIATPFLNSFSVDLTRSAMFGQLEPLIGRNHEIEAIFRAFQGGGASVILVGEHGVGKRAMVHGIADLMVAERVPDVLQDHRLVEIDVARLLSGVSPAEAEDRLLTMLTELETAGNIILSIPHVEKLVGITIGQQQSMDVASVLTQELGKRNFLTIATTTPDAYARVIASQSLGSVFQKIDIDEPDVDTVIRVLAAKAAYIEYKHGVWFSYAALERAAQMARKFLRDVRVPYSAIEVCSESALHSRSLRGAQALVTPEDVAAVIADKTKIPLTAVTQDEGAKLMRLESEMHRRVVGQDEAVSLVANSLRRSRAELRSGSRPIANFLFLGPSGVGKTELTKTIAEVYFGSEQQMIRLDMSEFQDSSAVSRLIGRAGEQGSGLLTEAVRQKPFSLILLDEIEKADAGILNLFLQVMDDGRLTDSVGRVIDFTNAILIATSNAGTPFVQAQMRAGTPIEQIKNQLIHGELKENFRPEFLNRFDAIVLFQPLTQDQIESVARLMLGAIGKKLAERGIVLEATPGGIASLARAGFDPEFGARPLRRVIQDRVENQIAGLLLQNQVSRNDTIVVDESGVHVRR